MYFIQRLLKLLYALGLEWSFYCLTHLPKVDPVVVVVVEGSVQVPGELGLVHVLQQGF